MFVCSLVFEKISGIFWTVGASLFLDRPLAPARFAVFFQAS